ncbi:hypothetical protein [Bacillus sp. OTU530]|uniref:hypothetical protein n=1 Tax=Bacillus sp. OTU530 TaxID=3043862 RepID=UPI00313F3789
MEKTKSVRNRGSVYNLHLVELGKEFEVYADITLPISIKVHAKDHENAMEKVMLELDDGFITHAMLTLVMAGGKVITPNVHDANVEFSSVETSVFSEED